MKNTFIVNILLLIILHVTEINNTHNLLLNVKMISQKFC